MFMAAILIDFVIVTTAQKGYIRENTRLHQTWAAAASQIIGQKIDIGQASRPGSLTINQQLRHLCKNFGTAGTVIIGATGEMLHESISNSPEVSQALSTSMQQALLNKTEQTSFLGRTWGVFSPQSHYFIIATPLPDNRFQAGAIVGTAFNLEKFYAAQRQRQQFLLIFTFINIAILTFLGTAAISRLTLRPINRLIKRTEEYGEENEFAFLYGQEKTEFRQLSNSLNQMVYRISGDKKELQNSLDNLKKAHTEITTHQNELIRAEKLASVGRLSAGLAHEIGNPIGIVLGYLEILNQPSLAEDEKKDYISRCQKEINRINNIIRELLDFSRPPLKEPQQIFVHDLIRETINMMSVQPVIKNIKTSLNLNAPTDTLVADPDRLQQVLVNLIINAADAISSADTHKNGEITINSTVISDPQKSGQAWLKVTIQDNGPGLTDKNMDNIFDPFYTTKEPGQGTGLGLSVCFMIIDNMGGTITAANSQDRGATFTIRLPLTAET